MENKSKQSWNMKKKVYVFGAILAAVMMMGVSLGVMISATTPTGFPTVIEPGSMVSGYSYIIFQSGISTYAKNGTTGAIAFNGISAGTVIQDVINDLNASGGGSILIRKANYTLTNKILITGAHFKIEAEPGTVFNSALMPCFEVKGVWFDGGIDITVNDIELKNLAFFYTGSPQNGRFIYLHHLQYDYKYQGQIRVENMMVWRSQASTSTNMYFVGLGLEDIVGAEYDHIAIKNFGTGIQYNATYNPDRAAWEQGATNTYDHVTLSGCYYGVWETTASVTTDIWNQLKVLINGDRAWFGTGPLNVIFNSPHMESVTGTGIHFSGRSIVVTSGVFSYINGYGIYLNYWGVNGENHALVQDSWFSNVVTGILTQRNLTLIGNQYTGTYTNAIYRQQDGSYPYPTVISFHDQYKTISQGIANIVASTTVTFSHNLSDSFHWVPTLVLASFNSTGTGAWSWIYTGGNNVQITITVAVSGTYTVYWYASNS